jgi:NAD(P)-dependent dehydrogenase (short-subunit alcohol dehydrogenase family)
MPLATSERPVALVTGAGRGIGLGIARALATAGHRVVLGDVDADAARLAAGMLVDEGREAIGLALEVTEAQAWDRAVAEVADHWGRLDVLVNSAGISPRSTAETTDEALWERTLAVNLKGPWLGIRACLPWLKASRGAIVNIGSTRATRPMPGLFAYITSKAGLLGLTRQVAVEYLEAGINCNMVAPGWVDTPGERILQAKHGRPDFPAGVRNLTTAEEVGEAVVFFTTAAGRKVSGQILYVDSGMHVADDAAMVYLPRDGHARYHDPEVAQRPEGP